MNQYRCDFLIDKTNIHKVKNLFILRISLVTIMLIGFSPFMLAQELDSLHREKKNLNYLLTSILNQKKDSYGLKNVELLVNASCRSDYYQLRLKYTNLLQKVNRNMFSEKAVNIVSETIGMDSLVNPYTLLMCGYLEVGNHDVINSFADTATVGKSTGWFASIALARLGYKNYESITIKKIGATKIRERYFLYAKHLAYINTTTAYHELINMLNSDETYPSGGHDPYSLPTNSRFAFSIMEILKKKTKNIPSNLVDSYNLEEFREWFNSGEAVLDKDSYVYIH